MSEIVTDRDRELAAYWTERGDLRAWIAGIIAATRRVESARCAEIVRDCLRCCGVERPWPADLERIIEKIRSGETAASGL